MSLFIMTNKDSHHTQLMIMNKNIAGTISPQPKNIIDIKKVFNLKVRLRNLQIKMPR